MGVSEDQIQQYIEQRASNDDEGSDENEHSENTAFEVWPGNELAIDVFWRVRRQWHRAGLMGLPVCLRDDAVWRVMKRMKKSKDFNLFEDVMSIGDGFTDSARRLARD